MRGLLLPVARVAVPVLALVVLARRFGAPAFRPALDVLAPAPVLAALLLGGLAVAAQAARWRVMVQVTGGRLAQPDALVECYRACAINTVVPGGVAGDALRAWRQRAPAPRGWRSGAVPVVSERACGLCLLLAAATAVLLAESQPVAAALAAMAAALAWAVARPALRRLSRGQRAAVWGWSALALAALVTLTLVAAAAVDAPGTPLARAVIGLVLLAGMAVPLSLGGWGPREAAAALAAVLVGAPAAAGVATAAGYGLLATVSVLPGFLAVVGRRRAGPVAPGRRQVELDADVLTEHEAS